MIARPFTQPVRARRAEAVVFAILGTASLLCLMLAVSVILSGLPTQETLAQSTNPGTHQLAAYPPQWQADARTAYHAMLYLLDPRV